VIFTRPTPGPENSEFDAPDNICMSPYGGLMMCEDGIGDGYMLGATRDGEVFHFARNIYDPGITFAVTGLWNRRHDYPLPTP
jgi:secreted PhoX family phosphatase